MVGASPQTGNGHTRFANELLQAIYRFPFSAAQLRLVLWIGRNSYGWSRKKTEARSLNDINKETGVPRSSIEWAMKTLIKAGVIQKDEQGRYALNKDYTTWVAQDSDLLPLSNGLDRAPVSNGLDGSSNGLDESVQPVGQNGAHYKVPKASKERIKKSGTFVPPALEEVVAYCSERRQLGKPAVNADKWFNHYTANGWRVGRNPMKDWKAAVRTWESMATEFGGRPGAKPAAGAAPQAGKYGARP